MQALAREMNLSETTFILPREPAIERERGVRVRIFTVQEELPFAGHPTLGTAFWLRGSTGASEVALELNVGKVPIRFEEKQGQPVFGEMTQVGPTFGPTHDRETVVRATSLRDGDIDPSLPIQTVSTGMAFTVVPLRGLEAIRRLQVDLKSAGEYLERAGGGKFFYFVTRETVDPTARLHARMLFYNGEDPATGFAAGCAAAGWSQTKWRSRMSACLSSRESKCCVRVVFLSAHLAWMTEWLTCAWEEMLWKFCAAKFFSKQRHAIDAKKCRHAQARFFFNGAN